MGSSLGLWWFAPVLSGGGYGSEAVALLLGLHRASDSSVAVRATHHGDAMDPEHFFGLPSSSRDALEATLRASTPSAERAVVVCHSEPGAWHPALYETSRCPPAGAAVAVGGRRSHDANGAMLWALLWLWAVDGIKPQTTDWIGAALCLSGMAVIMLGARS